jgi:hypothetical protein
MIDGGCWRGEVSTMHGFEQTSFDAYLPHGVASIRVGGLYDAQVFVRRWTIRDKDPALKALGRRLDRVSSAEAAASALGELQSALASRGLLRRREE